MDLPDDLLEPKLLQDMLLLETLYILGALDLTSENPKTCREVQRFPRILFLGPFLGLATGQGRRLLAATAVALAVDVHLLLRSRPVKK